MNKHINFLWGLSALVFSLVLPAHAEVDIQIHGFGSIGYIDTQDNNLYGESKDGTFEFNEIGLNVNAQLADNLRAGFQVFSRDLMDIDNNRAVIDWALLDYRYTDGHGIQVGKVKAPSGLYNDTRDYDFLRTKVFLPTSSYPESLRDFLQGAVGVALYGNFDFGNFGSLDYRGVYGNSDMSEDGGAVTLIEKESVLESVYDVDVERVMAGSLIWNTPLEGLRVGATINRLDNMVFSGYSTYKWAALAGMAGLDMPIGSSAHNHTDKYERMSFFAEYQYVDWIFAYEYQQSDLIYELEELTFLPQAMQRNMGYYLSVEYQGFENIGLAVTWDNAKRNDSLDPSNRRGAEDIYFSARYDFSSQWLIKAEYHRVDGTVLLSEGDNPDGMKEDWGYLAIKTTYNF